MLPFSRERIYGQTMRVTSEFYVSALIRRLFSAGDFAAVGKKGAAEAGAVFIRQRFRDGTETLYGPAPQSYFDESRPDGRQFEIRLQHQSPGDVADMLAREQKFDPDLWIIEFETETIDGLIDLAGAEEKPNPLNTSSLF